MESSLIYMLGFLMIAVGIAFLFLLFRGTEARRPRDVIEWIGAVLSGVLVVAAAIMMVLASSDPAAQANISASPEAFEDMVMEVPSGDFSFTRLDDMQEGSLSEFRGKVLIVNFWGTWCAPCLEEIPALNRLQNEYREQGLVILSVSDESADVLTSFETMLPLDTESVFVPEGIDLPAPFTGAMIVRPTSFVIDRDGIVRRYLLGNRSYSFFRNAVEPYL